MSTEEARENPCTLGYYLPRGDPELDPDEMGYQNAWTGLKTPFNWGAQYYRGLIYVSDISTGMYVIVTLISEQCLPALEEAP